MDAALPDALSSNESSPDPPDGARDLCASLPEYLRSIGTVGRAASTADDGFALVPDPGTTEVQQMVFVGI